MYQGIYQFFFTAGIVVVAFITRCKYFFSCSQSVQSVDHKVQRILSQVSTTKTCMHGSTSSPPARYRHVRIYILRICIGMVGMYAWHVVRGAGAWEPLAVKYCRIDDTRLTAAKMFLSRPSANTRTPTVSLLPGLAAVKRTYATK